MNTVDLFEKKSKKLVRDITPEEFAELLNDESLKEEFFNDSVKFDEIIEGIRKRTSNEEFRKVLLLFHIDITLGMTERDILVLFQKYTDGEIERNELLETLTTNINNEDPLKCLSYTLCSLTSTEDLEIDSSVVSNAAKKLLSYFSELTSDLVISYTVRTNLLDLLCFVRAKYFRLHSVDILDDSDVEVLRGLLRELHDFEDKIMLEKAKEIYPESEELPEELGLIDITKLHKDTED